MKKPPLNQLNFWFLLLTPAMAIIAIPLYAFYTGFDLFEWAMFVLFMALTGFSITGGYHRLWSHKSYKAHFTVRLALAIWGAASCQNSILHWASDHRRHHRHVDDRELDPYSIRRGFWHAHMGWILRRYQPVDFSNVKDLMRDPIVRWQHRWYIPLVALTCIIIPLAIGYAHGKLFGVLLLAGLLRVVLNHHFTFFINSLAHVWGRRPYQEHNSARDNYWLALLTYGEGYHNYHHCFQHDYRNGVRWWQFDPSKWVIKSFSWIGLTSHLKRATSVQIEKARMAIQFKRALARLEPARPGADLLRETLEKKYQQTLTALNDWARIKQERYQAKRDELRECLDSLEFRNRFLELKYGLKLRRRQWRLVLSQIH